MNRKREIISILLALTLLLSALLVSGWVLFPEEYVSGMDWSKYKTEPENSIDVFFVGSSMTFCNIIPAVVYESSGVTGYDIAGPEQTIPISYYYILEACRTQLPKAVFLELGGMYFSRFEEHTASNIASMPRGANRLGATVNAANRDDMLKLFFPIFEYHFRWDSFTLGELREKLRRETDITAGYEYLSDREVQNGKTFCTVNDSYYDYSLHYLRKISDYCAEKGIELYFFLAPTRSCIPDAQKARLERDIAQLSPKAYFDFSTDAAIETIGLDDLTDWKDGKHLNVYGAEKFSELIAQLLIEYGFEPTENADALLWQRRIDFLCENS